MDSRCSSKMNWWFMPSLKHLAAVRLASILCDRRVVIRNVFKEDFSSDRGISEDGRLLIERSVLKKVPKLQLPRELEKFLISYIHPVVFQILDWIDFHVVKKYVCVSLADLPEEFFWTPQGNIDSKKVAQILVNDKKLDIFIRFRLSCIYCFEEHIMNFSKILPGVLYEQDLGGFVELWVCYLFREMHAELHFLAINMKLSPEKSTSDAFGALGFLVSVTFGNEAATRYFLHRLTPADRAELLVDSTKTICRFRKIYHVEYFSSCHHVNNLIYLLSEMNESEQMKVLTVHTLGVLHCLLNWPWQCFFLRTAKQLWQFLNMDDYYILLRAISEKLISEAESMHYQGIFDGFWQQGSSADKRYVIRNGGLESLLPALIKVGDAECIKLVFNSTTELEREEFLFCATGQMICDTLIKAGKWRFLKFFIQECTSSKEVFCELKEKVIKALPCDVIKKDCNMFKEFQLLFDVEHECKRKCIDDKDSSLTKKLRTKTNTEENVAEAAIS